MIKKTAISAESGIVDIVIRYCMSILNDFPGIARNVQLDIIVAKIDIPTAQPGSLRSPKK